MIVDASSPLRDEGLWFFSKSLPVGVCGRLTSGIEENTPIRIFGTRTMVRLLTFLSPLLALALTAPFDL